jgi:hypothetical protein
MSQLPPPALNPPPVNLDALIREVIPDPDDWRKRPNPNLNWETPDGLIAQGRAEDVRLLVEAVKYGVFG